MKRIILAAVAAILLFSCNKELNRHSETAAKVANMPTGNSNFSFHGSGFYDSLGILHNQILHSFLMASRKEGRQTPEYFRHFLFGYMSSRQSENTVTAEKLSPESVLDIIKRYLQNDFGTIEKPEVNDYLKAIFNTVKATESFDTVLYKMRLLKLENSIREDHNLFPKDKDMLLATAAIARYSGCYWLNFYATQADKIPSARLKLFDKLVKAIGVTLADASAVVYDYLSGKPMNEWVQDASWFSELGYWSIDYILSGTSY